MPENALERLMNDVKNSSNTEKAQYSVDEQLDIEEDEDFFEQMSENSRDELFSRAKIEKVELDEEEEDDEEDYEVEDDYEPVEVGPIEDSDFEPEVVSVPVEEYEEPKRGRGRPRKLQVEEEPAPVVKQEIKVNNLNTFMDSLANDLIEELKASGYKTKGFSREQTFVVLDYLQKKI